MPNPELEAQHAKELAAAMSGLSSLTVEELQEGWRHWSAVEESASELSVTDTQSDGSGLGALASDGGQSLDDKEAMEDAKLTRVFADRMAAVHREELRRRGLELKSGWGERPAWGPVPVSETTDPTGHYDDGHSFGWKKPEAQAAPADALDTGHYDDGHAFGWNTGKTEGEPEATKPAKSLPTPLIAGGAAVVLVLAAVGFGLARSSSPASAPTEVPAVARASAPVIGSARAAAACALVTAAEATTILGTTTSTDTSGDLCNYTPAAPGADFAVKETGPRGEDLTQDIRIAKVVIRSATGAQAASSYTESFALFDPSKGDELVPGIGDKAFYSRGGLYVLQGSKFLAITTTSQQSVNSTSPLYPPVHAKFLSILAAFANVALPRLS